MAYLRRKKQPSFLKFASIAILVMFIGGFGRVLLLEGTNGKPLEVWALHELAGRNELEKCYAIEEQAYQQEIENMRRDMDILRNDKVSRGEVERIERLEKDKVIKAIDGQLRGALLGKGEFIYYASKENNVNPMLVAAIARHETGNGTSQICVKNNNPGGITSGIGFAKYPTLEAGIEAMVRLLKNEYIDKGRTTIESIGKKYCPINASNDPQKLNKYWIPMVTNNYQRILEVAKR